MASPPSRLFSESNAKRPQIPSIVTDMVNDVQADEQPYTSPGIPSSSTSVDRSRTPGSDPSFLSPSPKHQVNPVSYTTLDFSRSASEDDIALTFSPSPSLSSVHAAIGKILQENRPSRSDCLISPGGSNQAHKVSTTTFVSTTNEDMYPDCTHSVPACPSLEASNLINPTSHGSTSNTYEHKPGKPENSEKRLSKDYGKEKGRSAEQAEPDSTINPYPFAFKPYALAALVDPKDLIALEHVGGEAGLLRGLGTDRVNGLSNKASGVSCRSTQQRSDRHTVYDVETAPGNVAAPLPVDAELHDGHNMGRGDDNFNVACSGTLEDRRRVYGENVLWESKNNSLRALVWFYMKDNALMLLCVTAIASLVLGLVEDFDHDKGSYQKPVDWVEGAAILIAATVLVAVCSLRDRQKEWNLKILCEKKKKREIKVIRNGIMEIIRSEDVLVGDIALLEPGEIVPCDGVFLSGYNVKCDESAVTGESDVIKKVPFEQLTRDALVDNNERPHTDCFIISGSKVLEGCGKYVVIAVGVKSFNGRILMTLKGDVPNSPLQIKLNRIANFIANTGGAIGLVFFLALMIRYFVQLATGHLARNKLQRGIAFVDVLIISVTLGIIVVPKCLPSTLSFAFAFAAKQMSSDNLLVRASRPCQTVAGVTVICANKTGIFTQNSMVVVAGSVGIHAKFARITSSVNKDAAVPNNLSQPSIEEDVTEEFAVSDNRRFWIRRHEDDFSVPLEAVNLHLSHLLKSLFNEAIAINTTAFEDTDRETGESRFFGSKMEIALLMFAKELGWSDYRTTRESAKVVQMITGNFRVYLKGATEVLSSQCTRHVIVKHRSEEEVGVDAEVETKTINEAARDNIGKTIICYANQSLKTIALCYRDFECWPPPGVFCESVDEVSYEGIAFDLTLIGIIGIEDPLHVDVHSAVDDCHKAGISVRMCTGDNIDTARSIASQCGIYTRDGIAMEGSEFGKLSAEDKKKTVPRIQVLARASPEEKKLFVDVLQSLDEIVCITGGNSDDGPVLKAADVGFSMGISGTEVAKEASHMVLLDDSFSSIIRGITWGRRVIDAICKLLQFQITAIVTTVIIVFVSAVSSDQGSALTAVQLLWINLITDTFAVLLLATDPPLDHCLTKKPGLLAAPLISDQMIKQIIGQSFYQVTIILIFHFHGNSLLGIPHPAHNDLLIRTLVFNMFVFTQICNSVNCRQLNDHLNVFKDILKNPYFIFIVLIEISAQVLIIFVGGAAFQVTRIGALEWGISLAFGFATIPIGTLIRLFPTSPFKFLFIKLKFLPNPDVLSTRRRDELAGEDNLTTFTAIRGHAGASIRV